jgi:hypothetical protein
MENRRLATSSLGETGLEITRVGFGARVIGGSSCSRSVRAAAVRLSGPGPVSGIRLARWGAPRLAAVLLVITTLAGCGGAGPPPVTFAFEHVGPITLALPVGQPPGPDHAQHSADHRCR